MFSYQKFIEESKNLMHCWADNFVGSRIVQPNLKIGLALAFRLSQWQFVKPSSQDLFHEFLVRIFAFITISQLEPSFLVFTHSLTYKHLLIVTRSLLVQVVHFCLKNQLQFYLCDPQILCPSFNIHLKMSSLLAIYQGSPSLEIHKVSQWQT